jgi:hypothetical protein
VARRDHAGKKIRRSGPWIAEHSRDLPGRFVQPFRHMNGGSLMTNRHKSHFVLFQFGQQRIDLGTRNPKHKANTLNDQASQQKFSSSDFAHKDPSKCGHYSQLKLEQPADFF